MVGVPRVRARQVASAAWPAPLDTIDDHEQDEYDAAEFENVYRRHLASPVITDQYQSARGARLRIIHT